MALPLIHKIVAIVTWLVVVLFFAAGTAGEDAAKKTAAPPIPTRIETEPYFSTNTPAHAATARLREGEKITDVIGEFHKSGDRYTFSPQDGKAAIRVLENLSLERVARSLEDDPTPRMWSVSGVITEFRGENYLLLQRSQLKPRATIPTRTQPAENKKKEL